jgi:phosphoglycerate dehydrogenase-like enzyme
VSTSIAVLDDYQHVALGFADWGRLEGRATVTVFPDHLTGDDALHDRLAPFDIVVSMRERTPFSRSLLERLGKLKLLVTTGMANAAIDVAAAAELGIVVSGTGGLASPTAELTWGLIIALTRNLPAEDANIRRGGWQSTIGPELAGKTLGVIGLGNLGRRVAVVGRAFGMDVMAWSQNLTAPDAERVGATLVGKDELLARSDVVTIHLKLSERTRGLIGREELALMRPTSYLINTSRGPIVDEAALVDALTSRRIAGAGLDVFDVEPLAPEHPLRTLPNTIVTPHIGYVTTGTYEVFYGQALADIEAYLAGEPIRVLKE